MGKTVFNDGDKTQGIKGTRVLAAFLNAIFQHRHDGKDQDGSAPLDYAADTGAANAYAIALTPALTAHVAGLPIHFKAFNANTGASTLDINGLGAVAIKQVDGSAVPAGAIVAGQICTVIYTGTVYMLVSASVLASAFARTLLDDADAAAARTTLGISSATTAAEGIVELATTTEARTMTDTSRAITAAGLKYALNMSGSAGAYVCRAWGNFDGTGTPTLRSSGNCSGITDVATGKYIINLATAMPHADYAYLGGVGQAAGGDADANTVDLSLSNTGTPVSKTTTQVQITTRGYDLSQIYFAIVC